jgi:mono/diheme cytochrome c family protein
VGAAADRKAASREAIVVDLGDRVGVLRPIPNAALCVQCHGPVGRLAPDVRAFLAVAYPDDRAVGFEEGDVRGFVWAEAPTHAAAPPQAPPQPDAGIPSAGETLFAEANPRCILCHSAAGKGNPKGAPLDGVGQRLSRDEIKAWLRTPVEMAKKRGSTRKPAMVPYPEFSDDELDALAAYVASLEPGPKRE